MPTVSVCDQCYHWKQICFDVYEASDCTELVCRHGAYSTKAALGGNFGTETDWYGVG